ncbi:MAG: GNAT family N-acetyltransferase [Candidatus Heimdallarchaeota archaeon]|nr:GNAT family N-acetyltransferase [Candidatus Heimdallarchaeota archaeon]
MSNKKQKLQIEPSTQIESDRLIIRKYEKGDGKELFALLERNDNRTFLKDHVDEATDVKSLEDAETRVKSLSADWDARNRFVMGVWSKKTNEFIGNIWIEPKKWEVPSFEVGYYLDQGYTSKGLATEAVKRSIEFIFAELKAHKVILITRDTNERSYKLAERLKFVKEGHFRESNKEGNRRFGLLYFGMLKTEYEKLFKRK